MAEHSVLRDLTRDQIQQAFEKARAEVSIPGVKLILITEEYYDIALKFAREHFVPVEPITKALGVQWTDEFKELFWLNTLKCNLSLMFINAENGEAMAFRLIRIARYDDKIDLDTIQTRPLNELLHYCIYCDVKADFFGHYGTMEAFHFLGLAVAEKYKRRGLAKKIVRAAIEMIRNFGINPVYIKGEGSSNFSKKIYEKAMFDLLYEKPFDTWEVDGKFPIQNTGEHKSMKVYGLKV